MSIQGLMVSLVLAVVVGLWITAPLFRRKTGNVNQEMVIQKQRERVLAYYERVLTNIRDLEEDHSTGKMNAEDYEVERELWVQRGVEVLKALDQLDARQPVSMDLIHDGMVDDSVDSSIEAAIASYRSKSSASS